MMFAMRVFFQPSYSFWWHERQDSEPTKWGLGARAGAWAHEARERKSTAEAKSSRVQHVFAVIGNLSLGASLITRVRRFYRVHSGCDRYQVFSGAQKLSANEGSRLQRRPAVSLDGFTDFLRDNTMKLRVDASVLGNIVRENGQLCSF